MLRTLLLRSWAIGIIATLFFFAISAIGTHTPLQLFFIFLVPALALADAAVHSLTGSHPHGDIPFYGSMLFAGSLFYGLIALIVLRWRQRKRPHHRIP